MLCRVILTPFIRTRRTGDRFISHLHIVTDIKVTMKILKKGTHAASLSHLCDTSKKIFENMTPTAAREDPRETELVSKWSKIWRPGSCRERPEFEIFKFHTRTPAHPH